LRETQEKGRGAQRINDWEQRRDDQNDRSDNVRHGDSSTDFQLNYRSWYPKPPNSPAMAQMPDRHPEPRTRTIRASLFLRIAKC